MTLESSHPVITKDLQGARGRLSVYGCSEGAHVAYDLNVAKTLVRVLAVSIAALLFAACGGGGGSSSTAKAEESTTTTVAINYAAQYLALVAPVNEAVQKFQASYSGISIFDSVAVEAAVTPLANSLEAFGNALLRSSWPESAKPAITQLAQNAIQQAVAAQGLIDIKEFQVTSASERIQRLESEGRGYSSTVRALLNLPPPE